jgi:hypothetical protein
MKYVFIAEGFKFWKEYTLFFTTNFNKVKMQNSLKILKYYL